MPRSIIRISAIALLCCLSLLLVSNDASARRRREFVPLDLCTIELGGMASTFVGPSHDNLLMHINRIMPVLQSPVGYQFEDFGAIVPISLRMVWNVKYPVALSATYTFGQFQTESDFMPFEWDSHRTLTTNTHIIDMALQYSLQFIRSRVVMPYIGMGLSLGIAASTLDIDLINTPQVAPAGEDMPPYPDRLFQVKSTDFAIGAIAMAGLTYHVNRRSALVVEIAGMMNQVNQNFDFDGTLQYTNPGGGIDPTDPRTNDILSGNYPLKMNGIRVSLGILIGI
ncbi:MAG: hypothetical protein GY835_05910 [bacterium]|nr:hypothetical protein [bacterium]